ncbi:MAG: FHA domain-containing protein [Myxococcaceae bacterium]|nr:FHA domain-containing protein [Myxococcaceae bacterium]
MAPPPSGAPRRRPTSAGTGQAPAVRARRPSTAQAPAVKPKVPEAEAASIKLVCLAGPQAGSEYVLEGDEMVIGRAADNAISIPDTSVSRKHVLLRNTGSGWAASDMGSGNGTLINQSAIAEETPLSDGDVITLGDTELKIVIEGGGGVESPSDTGDAGSSAPLARRNRDIPVRSGRAPVRSSRGRMAPPDPEAAAKKKKLFIRIGAGLVLVLLAVVGWQVKKAQDEKDLAGKNAKKTKALEELRAIAQEGKNLIREGKWIEAKAKFEEVLSLNPEFGNGTIQPYIERASKEIPTQQALDAAEEGIKASKLGVAAKELEKVHADTQQYERRDKLKEALEKAMDKKVKDAQMLLGSTDDRAKMVQLKEMAEDLLVVQPEHREGLEFKKTADEAIDRIDHPVKCQYGTCAGKCCPPPTPWTAVQERFKSGDQSGAFAMAQACASKASQCKVLQEQIKDFMDKFKKLESLSPPELRALLQLDRKIGGGPSTLAKQIGVRIVAHYIRKASSCKAKGDMACAGENAQVALEADPGNPEATDILRQAKSYAKELYMKCYAQKAQDPDDAMRCFKQVVDMTTKDDEYHQKAQNQLKKGDN